MKVGILIFISLILGMMHTSANAQEYYAVLKKKAIKQLEPTHGVHDFRLEMTDNRMWDVRISFPEMEDDQKYPLVLALHWAGGGDTFKEYADCLVLPALQDFKGIVVIPSGDNKHWVHPSNDTRLIDLIKKVSKFWPIDKKRIYLTGYSNGAIGSWKLALEHPKLFAGALLLSGYYTEDRVKIPIHVLHGNKDELFNIHEVELMLQFSQSKGSHISLTKIPGFSHYMACDYMDAMRKAIPQLLISQR